MKHKADGKGKILPLVKLHQKIQSIWMLNKKRKGYKEYENNKTENQRNNPNYHKRFNDMDRQRCNIGNNWYTLRIIPDIYKGKSWIKST